MGTGSDAGAFFLVGCVSLDKARQLFDTASLVCEIVDGVRQCLQN
ncbi:hypothetical protein RCL95_09680 [Escherichia marmotae]|nr:hypothetical protein [Escherichia marmotae]MED8724231.1 hypothetical protein [Escherichia marmotae]MED8767247.1 hypothetical protein [Escherichia marmotae]MED9036345.1 hypothetical protein [Escherichia marmotae]